MPADELVEIRGAPQFRFVYLHPLCFAEPMRYWPVVDRRHAPDNGLDIGSTIDRRHHLGDRVRNGHRRCRYGHAADGDCGGPEGARCRITLPPAIRRVRRIASRADAEVLATAAGIRVARSEAPTPFAGDG